MAAAAEWYDVIIFYNFRFNFTKRKEQRSLRKIINIFLFVSKTPSTNIPLLVQVYTLFGKRICARLFSIFRKRNKTKKNLITTLNYSVEAKKKKYKER